MSEVQGFYDRIKDHVEIVWPPEAMEYGTLKFGIRDGDGYTLAFAEHQETPQSVKSDVSPTNKA
jgi:hypothetical protein